MASPCQLSTFRLQLSALRTLVSQSVQLYLTLQLIVSCLLVVTDAATCKKMGACSCESSAMKVDLSPLANVPGGKLNYVAAGKNPDELFFYNPCKTFSNTSKPGEKGCQDTLLCQENAGLFYPLADMNHVDFSGSPEDKNLVVNYTVTTRKTSIALICDSQRKVPLLKYLDEKPPQNYTFEFHTDLVCLPAEPKRISTGSVLVILFFVILVIYLVGGVLFLRIVRGAEGSEMIPHRQFWLDFPKLVKDGAYFVCSGCKTDTTYEQI